MNKLHSAVKPDNSHAVSVWEGRERSRILGILEAEPKNYARVDRVARLFGVPVPAMRELLDAYRVPVGKRESVRYGDVVAFAGMVSALDVLAAAGEVVV